MYQRIKPYANKSSPLTTTQSSQDTPDGTRQSNSSPETTGGPPCLDRSLATAPDAKDARAVNHR